MSLFFVNCERTVLFSVKRDLDPPPPPFSTLFLVSSHKIRQLFEKGVIHSVEMFTLECITFHFHST